MERLTFTNIQEANGTSIAETVKQGLDRLTMAQRVYPPAILKIVADGDLSREIDRAYKGILKNPRASPLSNSAGAYFGVEEIISNSEAEEKAISFLKKLGIFYGDGKKLKLGPGIGFVEAPSLYTSLIKDGLQNPDLTLNYTGPSGTSETRKGIKAIVDSKIDPEGNFFPIEGVFLTQGATEAIDLFMSAISTLNPNSRVIFLGLSYYTGPFSAKQKGLTIERLMASPINPSSETKFFPTPEQISQSVPADTKAMVLTMPNNPNGEIYSTGELTKIIQFAKDRNILILFDAIFENMYYDESKNFQSTVLKTAHELGALDNIIIVDGLSKTMNFPGERIGYLATTNIDVIEGLTNIVLARICNPRLTLEPVLQFEGLARQVKTLQLQSPNTRLEIIIDKVLIRSNAFNKGAFLKMYSEWDSWNKEVLKFYKGNLEIVKAVLNSSIDAGSPDTAAFNTFIKLSGLPQGTNNMDYVAKLMFTLATYTQVGPCFGLSQKIWDRDLGVWSRITYACNRNDLIEGLARLVIFTKFYAEKNFGDPNKFPVLQISYDKQI